MVALKDRRQRKLRSFLLVLSLLTNAVAHGQLSEIAEKPVTEWNSRDCLIICVSAIQHNLYNNTSPIMVIATPYYPSVIMAMKRKAQIERKWSADQFFYEADTLGKDCLGLRLDRRTAKFIDHEGRYFSSFLQMDSLTVLLSLNNRGWPSQPPDISNLENNIYLVNDESMLMRPLYVWGKRNNRLLREEKLLVVFQLRSGNYHFLQHSSNMYLTVKGLPENVLLTFPLSDVK